VCAHVHAARSLALPRGEKRRRGTWGGGGGESTYDEGDGGSAGWMEGRSGTGKPHAAVGA